MNLKTALAFAALAGLVALPLTADAQGRSGKGKSDNGLHKGWYKQKNKHDKHDDKKYKHQHRNDDCHDDEHIYVYQGQRRNDGNRYENRYDSRYNQGYNTRYGNTSGSRWNTGADSRYNNPYTTQREADRRQQTKNEWRNIAYAAGAAAILGALQKDNTLMFAGAAGALYSLHRYEQDRKSQNSLNRTRARYFDNEYFIRDGQRYNRQVVTRDGQRYYQFVRAR